MADTRAFRQLAARGSVALALSSGLLACGPERDFDLDPPRVLSVTPRAPLVKVDAAFEVEFSEPMNALTVSAESIVIVPRAQVSEAFLADFASPPLTSARASQLLPVDVLLSGDELRVSIAPRAPLLPRTPYSLLLSADLRDQAGNPLVDATGTKATFRLDFTTDDGAPMLVATDVDGAGAGLVPPNRKRFSVTFNQPIRSLGAAQLRIESVDGLHQPDVASLAVEPDRTQATLLLADVPEGCERLFPERDYFLLLGPGITDDEGDEMPAERVPFRTGPLCDVDPLRMVGAPLVVAGEVAASLRFDTTKASTTELRFGLVGAPLDCLGQPCPVRGAPALLASPGVSPPRFVHAVDFGGLSVDVAYRFQVRAEDWVGHVVLAEGELQTAPLPKVVLNEVLADAPAGLSPDANGEFVELYNAGEEPIDLSGFALALDGGALAGGSTCELPDDGSAPVLAPGAFVILTNASFEGAAYGLFDESIVYRMGAGYLCGRGLANDGQPVAILDADGRPLSSFGGFSSLRPREGRSLERVAPDAPDVESGFCYSRSDTGPTPGAENGVRMLGCESATASP